MRWIFCGTGECAYPEPAKARTQGRVIGAANLLSFDGIALQPVVQYAMLRLCHPDARMSF